MKIILVCVAMSFTMMIYAQTEMDSMRKAMGIGNGKAHFTKPDGNFVALPDSTGYTYPRWNAKIKGLLFAGNYQAVSKEFSKTKNSQERKVIARIHHSLKLKSAFTLIQEEIAPPESNSENNILVTTVISNGHYTTFMVYGSYPKSHDKELRKKFIQASLSIRVKE